ncbi:MAG: universal stress protein [Pyrinomonadaceae bacterium]|nr:universal stress protein [Pyrinomonadaceae bacterium]
MRVLLAVDGSECSQKAVEEVATRIWRKGTKIKVFAVATSRIPEWFMDPAFATSAAHEVQVEEHHLKLNKLVKEIKSSLESSGQGENLEIETKVVEDYPKEAIVDEAESWNADLVIVGAHGYGKIKRIFLGSVSQFVSLYAPCSVQIVR